MTDNLADDRPNIYVLGGTHGNEPLGVAVHYRFRQWPFRGISTHLAHPEAVAEEVRFLGQTQLMDHYPGDALGDPEDAAAYNVMEWLGPMAGADSALVYDIHSSEVNGLNFFEIGARASAATVAGAFTLGFRRCVVRPDSFYRAVPNAASLELSVRSSSELEERTYSLWVGLRGLATKTLADLVDEYERVSSIMVEYYRSFEIRTAADDGNVSSAVMHLERMARRRPWSEIDVAPKIRNALGIGEGQLSYGNWGYENNSLIDPSLGNAPNGRPRRQYFGSIFERIGPPRLEGARLTFTGSLYEA